MSKRLLAVPPRPYLRAIASRFWSKTRKWMTRFGTDFHFSLPKHPRTSTPRSTRIATLTRSAWLLRHLLVLRRLLRVHFPRLRLRHCRRRRKENSLLLVLHSRLRLRHCRRRRLINHLLRSAWLLLLLFHLAVQRPLPGQLLQQSLRYCRRRRRAPHTPRSAW